MKIKYCAVYIICGLILLSLPLYGSGSAEEAGSSVEESPVDEPAETDINRLYLQKVEGLHVTGTPVKVDIEEYRLRVTGAVDKPLELTFEDVKTMEAVTKNMVLECPGFFVDQGDWTGVPVKKIIDRAAPKSGAFQVEFISIDESYSKQVALNDLTDTYLIAYLFDGKEFPEIHGYPLRLAAEGKPGSLWVKWLGEIRVLAGEN